MKLRFFLATGFFEIAKLPNLIYFSMFVGGSCNFDQDLEIGDTAPEFNLI